MTDQFARQKSTRWAKADVPSYGGWGDESDDYDDYNDNNDVHNDVDHVSVSTHSRRFSAEEPVIPKQQPSDPSASTLVLSIDKLKAGNDDEESDSSFDAGEAYQHTQEPERQGSSHEDLPHMVSTSTSSASASNPDAGAASSGSQTGSLVDSSSNGATMVTKNTNPQAPEHRPTPLKPPYNSSNADFLPPTPTYQSEDKFPISPSQDLSDRSYLSDADSIQREPENLNLRSFKDEITDLLEPLQTKSSVETPKAAEAKTEGAIPEPLVLSIDKLSTNNHDDSSDEELLGHEQHDTREPEQDSQESDDDWGYNSGHSSNIDIEDPEETPIKKEGDTQKENVLRSKHKVDTEALDSLINSLSQMESSSTYANDADGSFGGEDALRYESYARNQLPNLDSIHDFSMPDFNHQFSSDEEPEPLPIKTISEEGLKSGHETFVSNVRQPSIKKAPPAPTQDEVNGNVVSNASEYSKDSDVMAEESGSESKMVEEEKPGESEEASEEHVPEAKPEAPEESDEIDEIADLNFTQPLKSNRDADMSRRSSTISNGTFNMGAWNPNTNKFRDQFVNDNDNESSLNMVLDGSADAAYKKFTGSGRESNYAESVTNASFISVPETIDTNLHQINEDQSEEDEQPDCVSHFSTAKTLPSLSLSGNASVPSVPSVLREHQYETGKFHEQSPLSSSDREAKVEDEDESKSTLVEAESSRSASYSATKAGLKKYPVSNWKTIMSASQSVDRIKMLKKARQDEEMYDTGLTAWLHAVLKSTESSSHIQIGKLATHAYQNAQHSDIRRHTSIRSKVNQVRDKLDSGNFEKASSLGKKFFSRGKKLMKQNAE